MSKDIKRKDPREHAAAKADINIKLRDKVRELRAEETQLDQKISDLKLQAVRESDQDKVIQILAECKALEARREALPVILRGFQARALHAQAAALFEEAEDVKPDLDAAELELTAARELVPELEQRLEQAKQAVIEVEAKRDQLSGSYAALQKAAGLARADAGCIERGEPMKFEPTRFIGE